MHLLITTTPAAGACHLFCDLETCGLTSPTALLVAIVLLRSGGAAGYASDIREWRRVRILLAVVCSSLC